MVTRRRICVGLSWRSGVAHVRALDGFRGLAVLLVILFHFGYLEIGWTGVQIFFVLSGFLITSILVNESDLPLAFYLKRFYWRRTLRIFPLYFAYLAAVAVVYAVWAAPEVFGREWPNLFTYTFNFLRAWPDYVNSMYLGHFWSLSVEEQFYLFWPLLIFLTPRKRLTAVITGILIFGPIARGLTAEYLGRHFSQDHHYLGQAVYSVTWAQVDAFAIGALLAVRRRKSAGSLSPLIGCSMLLVGAGLVNTWLLKGRVTLDTSLGFPINMIRNGEHIWGYTLINFAAAALVLTCLGENRVSRLFRSRPLAYTGKISYGLYVYHLATQGLATWLVKAHPRSALGLAAFALDLGLLFGLAHLSYSLFERRFIRLKDRRFGLQQERNETAGAAAVGVVALQTE